jgi:CheY-like chemotaxis protein
VPEKGGEEKVLRDIEGVVRHIAQHRVMLDDLLSAQVRALLDLKELSVRSGGEMLPGTGLPDADAALGRAALARELLSADHGASRPAAPKVLLVDDDPTVRNIISHFLRKEGFVVEKAGNGGDGLAGAKAGRPDLIILDAVVPGMDGFELLSLLKKDPDTFSIPVLMLSALGEETAIIKGLEEGADYVLKPFSPQVLVAKVKKILKERRDYAVDRRPL